MANRHYVFADDVEIPPTRRPTPERMIPPGLPPADGQDPPEGWTPIRIQCQYVTEPDGTPSTLLLYSRPCAAPQHHCPDASTDDRPERYDGRRWSPEPLEVEGATRVVRLAEMLSLDQLQADDEYQQLVEDVSDEARRFGDLVKAVIPRPGPGADDPVVAGAGKVFLEYASLDQAIRCWEAMDGRWFARRQIVAGFYPEDMFAAGDYSCDGQN
ncbi:poly(U)-binding-splicing factor half pint-like [Lolium rigidum]|uniref:poly(U)-binding-splicing factor half pint-like n=1 Tax=Lolium rigidum TaxID=89674 RepID=UPI001F5CBC8D|nr:poly(U)-binding-splicing factor half pint-like [Lolium rigidum]